MHNTVAPAKDAKSREDQYRAHPILGGRQSDFASACMSVPPQTFNFARFLVAVLHGSAAASTRDRNRVQVQWRKDRTADLACPKTSSHIFFSSSFFSLAASITRISFILFFPSLSPTRVVSDDCEGYWHLAAPRSKRASISYYCLTHSEGLIRAPEKQCMFVSGERMLAKQRPSKGLIPKQLAQQRLSDSVWTRVLT